jgi:hypothetical protein
MVQNKSESVLHRDDSIKQIKTDVKVKEENPKPEVKIEI